MEAGSTWCWPSRPPPEVAAGPSVTAPRPWGAAGSGSGARLPTAAGQGIVEYGLILGLSALLAIAVLVLFPDVVAEVVRWVGETVDAATGG